MPQASIAAWIYAFAIIAAAYRVGRFFLVKDRPAFGWWRW